MRLHSDVPSGAVQMCRSTSLPVATTISRGHIDVKMDTALVGDKSKGPPANIQGQGPLTVPTYKAKVQPITGQINYPQILSLKILFRNKWSSSYIQEQNKARFVPVWESHILPFAYTLRHIFIPLCGRDLGFSIGRARVQIRNVVKSALLWQRLNALFLHSEYKVRGPF